MKSTLFAAAAALALGAAGAASAAPEVEIKHAVARVVVIPEAGRTEVKVEIIPGTAELPRLDVRTTGSGKVVIDGGLDRKIRGCNQSGIVLGNEVNPVNPPDNLRVRIKGQDDVRMKDAPLVTIRTPMSVKVGAGGAVYGSVGRSENLSLGSSGCGDWTVGNVSGRMDLAIAGSGDMRTGTAGDTEISISGSGDVDTGAVRQLEVNISGSGDVTVAQSTGPVDVSIAGSGDVKVKGGRISKTAVSIAGSGDVNVDADVADLNVNIMGGGDVRVRSAQNVSKHIMGGGSVVVGN
jgi:hypothetical protein